MKRYVVVGSVFALATAGVVACSDSNGTSIEPSYDGGAKPSPTTAPDPKPDGGDATAPSNAGDAGDAGDAGETGPSSDAGDAGAHPFALFVGTDFTTSELSVVGLGSTSTSAAVVGRLAIASGDAVPYASGGQGFVLDRKFGKVIVLDKAEPWKAAKTIDINDRADAGSYASNPHAVVVAAGAKAYVARYSSNKVKIVDTLAGTATGEIDLTPHGAVGDPDGIVEVEDAIYDAVSKRIYFLLQRIDQFEYPTPSADYAGKCLAKRGAVVAYDTTTDTVVDLNGALAGEAVDLNSANPGSLTADLAGQRLIVVGSGCYVPTDAGADASIDDKAGAREGRGVEAVSLVSGARSWLYSTAEATRLDGVIWVDGTHAYVSKASVWYAWNPTQLTLGAAAADFPEAPVYDGRGRIVGLRSTTTDAGVTRSVVGFDTATGTLTTLVAADPFATVKPASTASTLVR